jgi:hypothetical protein
MKIDLTSIGYGARRLSARGTTLKISTITITYTISSISDFRENFPGGLKTRVKIRSSRVFCWYFCWYRESKRSRRISAIPNERIEQMARKNHGASACRARRPPELARRLTTAAKRIALRCG